jgi:hypothetical protein
MQAWMEQTLRRLRVRRRWLLTEMALLGVAVGLLAEIGLIPTSVSTARAFLLVLLAGLLAVQASRLVRRFVSLVHSECPVCGGLFFVSWQRLYWSLPYLHASCAHCGLSLRGRR